MSTRYKSQEMQCVATALSYCKNQEQLRQHIRNSWEEKKKGQQMHNIIDYRNSIKHIRLKHSLFRQPNGHRVHARRSLIVDEWSIDRTSVRLLWCESVRLFNRSEAKSEIAYSISAWCHIRSIACEERRSSSLYTHISRNDMKLWCFAHNFNEHICFCLTDVHSIRDERVRFYKVCNVCVCGYTCMKELYPMIAFRDRGFRTNAHTYYKHASIKEFPSIHVLHKTYSRLTKWTIDWMHYSVRIWCKTMINDLTIDDGKSAESAYI